MLFPFLLLREHTKLIYPENFAIKNKISTNFWGSFSKKVIFSNRLTTRTDLFSSKVVQFLYVLQNHAFGKNLFSLVFSKWRLEKCKTLRNTEKRNWNGFILWTTKFCSNQCGKRTVNICSACDFYFCKTCFERKHQIFETKG